MDASKASKRHSVTVPAGLELAQVLSCKQHLPGSLFKAKSLKA